MGCVASMPQSAPYSGPVDSYRTQSLGGLNE